MAEKEDVVGHQRNRGWGTVLIGIIGKKVREEDEFFIRGDDPKRTNKVIVPEWGEVGLDHLWRGIKIRNMLNMDLIFHFIPLPKVEFPRG